MRRSSVFLVIALALTAFLAGYIMIDRGLSPTPQSKTGTILDKFGSPQPATTNEVQLPEEAKIFPISSVKVTSISTTADRKGVTYFEKNTGKLFEFNFEDNEERVVSEIILPNFLSSAWSPVKREALSLFYSPSGNRIKYYSYDTGKITDLDKNIRSAAFSPDGSLMVYYLTESKNTESPNPVGKVYLSQTDGAYPKKILDTRILDLEISWPIKDKISFSTPSAEVFLLTEAGGLTKLLESKPGLDTKWSKTGSKLLFSYFTDPGRPSTSLWLKDIESGLERDLGISTTASKCAWSIDNTAVFCAIPKTPSVDEIYKINTDTGSQELLAEPNMPIASLLLTSLENHLLLISAADEKLYGINILP
ncbi:MAG: PD40 domain-containing protein [Candidatus Yanofskybacteria bacterium]|nr:PD40 domain-containing protein [Candidatus Yanofskybacteria bacterium]